MHIGERIKERRKDLGLTQGQIAEYFDISSVSVSEWERGLGKPEQAKLPALARLLKTTVESLLDTSDRPTFKGKNSFDVRKDSPDDVRHGARYLTDLVQNGGVDLEPVETKGLLPLISDVQAGNWSEIVDNFQPGDAEDWIPCPFKHGPNAFILRVAGHSMFNPGGDKSYAPGDYIAVDPQIEPQNKRMVIAKIDHEERATFKQLIIEPDGTYMLQALNPSWPQRIMQFPPESRIIGVVIGKWTPE